MRSTVGRGERQETLRTRFTPRTKMGSNSICAITLRPYCLFSYEPEERLRGGVAEGQRQAARLSRANALASEVLIDKK